MHNLLWHYYLSKLINKISLRHVPIRIAARVLVSNAKIINRPTCGRISDYDSWSAVFCFRLVRTRCGATLRWVTHDLNFLAITRPYLSVRHCIKIVAETFYSVLSVKKKKSLPSPITQSALLESRDSSFSIQDASFAADFIRHCEIRDVTPLDSLSLSFL